MKFRREHREFIFMLGIIFIGCFPCRPVESYLLPSSSSSFDFTFGKGAVVPACLVEVTVTVLSMFVRAFHF